MSVFIDLSNIQEVCRICLQKSSNLQSFFTNIEFGSFTGTIMDILIKLTSEKVQVEKGLPIGICLNCQYLVEQAYTFKSKFEESTKILKCYLNGFTNILTEPKVEFEEKLIAQPEVEPYLNDSLELEDNNSNYDHDYTGVQSETLSKPIQNSKPGRTNVIVHPCPICTVELPASELREHAHTHKALKKYMNIPKVNKGCRFYALPRETVSIFNKSDILHICPYCDQQFSAPEFRYHVNNHRLHDQFQCDKCDRVFKKINHLNTHRVRHLEECPYKCEKCGKGFVIKKNYDCHILTHTETELPHQCPTCYKRFSNPEHLHRHSTIHTEKISYAVKYRMFKCRFCIKTFKTKYELTNHECKRDKRKTITSGQYPCKLCKLVFKYKSNIRGHMLRVHEQKVTRTLCSVCGSYVRSINSHMVRHQDKRFQCKVCGKKYSSKPVLRKHLLIHTGQKPFICSSCGKAFNNFYNLQVHERMHTGNKCHICHICNKGFLEKSYLRKHLGVHKNIKSGISKKKTENSIS